MKLWTFTCVFAVAIIFFLGLWLIVDKDELNTCDAKVTGATEKFANEYMTIVRHEDAQSGWAIKVKKNISEEENRQNLYLFFYARVAPDEDFEQVYGNRLCFMLGDRRKDFLPKEVIDMMFQKQNGSCHFKQALHAIPLSVKVHTSPKNNQATYLPTTTPYQLEARILDEDQANRGDSGDYLIEVSFDVGGDINSN